MPIKSARRALALALALTPLLAGCATMTAGNETRAALCDQFQPIRWSSADTDQTIIQAKQANAVGSKICGWNGR